MSDSKEPTERSKPGLIDTTSVFALPNAPAGYSELTNFQYSRLTPTTTVVETLDSTQHYTFKVQPSGNRWWLPSRSFFAVQLEVKHDPSGLGNFSGDYKFPPDFVYTHRNPEAGVFQAFNLQMSGMTVSGFDRDYRELLAIREMTSTTDPLRKGHHCYASNINWMDYVADGRPGQEDGAKMFRWNSPNNPILVNEESYGLSVGGMKSQVVTSGLHQVLEGSSDSLGQQRLMSTVQPNLIASSEPNYHFNGEMRPSVKQHFEMSPFPIPTGTQLDIKNLLVNSTAPKNPVLPTGAPEFGGSLHTRDFTFQPPCGLFEAKHALPGGNYELQLRTYADKQHHRILYASLMADRFKGAANVMFTSMDASRQSACFRALTYGNQARPSQAANLGDKDHCAAFYKPDYENWVVVRDAADSGKANLVGAMTVDPDSFYPNQLDNYGWITSNLTNANFPIDAIPNDYDGTLKLNRAKNSTLPPYAWRTEHSKATVLEVLRRTNAAAPVEVAFANNQRCSNAGQRVSLVSKWKTIFPTAEERFAFLYAISGSRENYERLFKGHIAYAAAELVKTSKTSSTNQDHQALALDETADNSGTGLDVYQISRQAGATYLDGVITPEVLPTFGKNAQMVGWTVGDIGTEKQQGDQTYPNPANQDWLVAALDVLSALATGVNVGNSQLAIYTALPNMPEDYKGGFEARSSWFPETKGCLSIEWLGNRSFATDGTVDVKKDLEGSVIGSYQVSQQLQFERGSFYTGLGDQPGVINLRGFMTNPEATARKNVMIAANGARPGPPGPVPADYQTVNTFRMPSRPAIQHGLNYGSMSYALSEAGTLTFEPVDFNNDQFWSVKMKKIEFYACYIEGQFRGDDTTFLLDFHEWGLQRHDNGSQTSETNQTSIPLDIPATTTDIALALQCPENLYKKPSKCSGQDTKILNPTRSIQWAQARATGEGPFVLEPWDHTGEYMNTDDGKEITASTAGSRGELGLPWSTFKKAVGRYKNRYLQYFGTETFIEFDGQRRPAHRPERSLTQFQDRTAIATATQRFNLPTSTWCSGYGSKSTMDRYGPIMYFKWPRDGTANATRATINFQYGGSVSFKKQLQVCLLFKYRKAFLVQTRGSRVITVETASNTVLPSAGLDNAISLT